MVGAQCSAPDGTFSVGLVQTAVQGHGIVAVLSQSHKKFVGVLLPVDKHKHLPFVAPLAQQTQKPTELGVCGHDFDHVIDGVTDYTPVLGEVL
jgi:hypothetical protein